ncbi:unnamed protein product [Caenorhabditis auriculariae]|uniref:Histone-lysine N-methyltransferase, H3 lysine-79 specific n=1 Tax=Caenorhabditis auriculariae TaxID=2777116 RepID=A0A8S1GMA0_9PELO|nr:unnamed protein product [Caenorhabditis auriculariae]
MGDLNARTEALLVNALLEPLERAQSTSSTIRSGSSDGDEIIKLCPVVKGGHWLRFEWCNMHTNIVNVVVDIVRRMKDQLENLNTVMKNDVEKVDRKDFASLNAFTSKYNKAASAVRKLNAGSVHHELGDWRLSYCTPQIAQIIGGYAFDCAVKQARALNNHYEPFSSEVYGETSLEQMSLIVEQLKLGPDDVFVDLGSGVGNLVTFVAAMANVKKSVGIEIALLPSTLAVQLQGYFEQFMAHFGKSYSPFELHKGDFLDEKFNDLLTKEATVIFINNYAFVPQLESKIKTNVIMELADGVRIVSTKKYATGSKEINQRMMTDVEAMLDVENLNTVDAPASWTPRNVPYFLHTVNRGKIEKYFEKMRGNGTESGTRRRGKDSKSSSSSSREGSHLNAQTAQSDGKAEAKEDVAGEHPFGPTTRNKWKAYVSSMDEKKPKSSTGSPRSEEPDRDFYPLEKKARKQAEKKEKQRRSNATTPRLHKRKVSSESPSRNSGGDALARKSVESTSRSDAVLGSEDRCSPRKNLHISPETMSTIDVMHEMIVSPPRHSTSDDIASGQFIRVGIDGVPIHPPKENPMNRPTFMIPPTDPLYDCIVGLYLGLKEQGIKAKEASEEYKAELRKDIEREQARRAELQESCREIQAQIDICLQSGVSHLKERLAELDMSGVQEVSELLYGSKQIVAQHKELTQRVSKEEALNAVEEAKLRSKGPLGDKLVDNIHMIPDSEATGDRYGAHISMILGNENQVVPHVANSSFDEPMDITPPQGEILPRRNRPRQRPGATGKRSGRSEEHNEEEDRQIRIFVQQALKVENMAKEKERRARGSGGTGGGSASERGSTRRSVVQGTAAAAVVVDPSLHRSGPLLPSSALPPSNSFNN